MRMTYESREAPSTPKMLCPIREYHYIVSDPCLYMFQSVSKQGQLAAPVLIESHTVFKCIVTDFGM